MEYMIGQRVILKGQGGVKEVGTVIPSDTGYTRGVWVYSPSRGYASDYDKNTETVRPLPNGQL